MIIATTYTSDNSDIDLIPVVALYAGDDESKAVKAVLDEIMSDCAYGEYDLTLISDGDYEELAILCSDDEKCDFARSLLASKIAEGAHTIEVQKAEYHNVYTLLRV